MVGLIFTTHQQTLSLVTLFLFEKLELDLGRFMPAGFKVHKLFVDATGNHVLISAIHREKEKEQDREDVNAELLYIHTSSNKPKQVKLISKFNVDVGFHRISLDIET